MKIGVLQTGHVNPALVQEFGEYPAMFERLLQAADPTLEFTAFDLISGARPEGVDAADAWLVTGSKFGAYDPEPWIAPLEAFLREAYAAGKPIVGICFGHQILAQALGGRVVKSEKGWGAGVHRYETAPSPLWGAGGVDGGFAAHVMHQDQVVETPQDATVIARSEFCPAAALVYGDAQAPRALTIQAHPEFEEDFERALIELRREAMGAEVSDPALESLGAPVDNAAIARVIAGFLRRAVA